MANVNQMQLDEVMKKFANQGVEQIDYAVVCVSCKTVQSRRDLIDAGAGDNAEEVSKYFGFSCVGRFGGKGCDWTLGGFFHMHELEVIDADGDKHPFFNIATPVAAQINANKKKENNND